MGFSLPRNTGPAPLNVIIHEEQLSASQEGKDAASVLLAIAAAQSAGASLTYRAEAHPAGSCLPPVKQHLQVLCIEI